MSVLRIDHINLSGSAALMEACRCFYVDVLGFEEGHRPPFRRNGFWLYANGHPILHLTETEAEAGATGSFDHFALSCDDAPAIVARLRDAHIEHHVTGVPGGGASQIFLHDPAGVAVELNFA